MISGGAPVKNSPMKKFAIFALALAAAFDAPARITAFGDLAEYGISPLGTGDPLDVNPHTWRVFTEMDGAKMLGIDAEHTTLVNAEYYTSFVQEGMKTGENLFAVSLSDRGEFFGGDGYVDLAALMPAEGRSAQQYKFAGGWKYNLNDYVHVDLGGTFTYATKRVCGPGIPGAGITFYGDFYAGVILDVAATPFVYYMYNPDFDAQKIMAGINPVIPLRKVFGIKNLSLEIEAYYGYVASNRWTGDNRVNGSYVKNSYGFVQAEASFVYVHNETWRFSAGGGYSYNNDGSGPAGIDQGPNHNSWFTTSVGFYF